jgi:hypothetical protein
MYLNLYEAQQLATERMKNAMREAEHFRLIQSAKGPRQARKWRLSAGLILSGLSDLFTRRQTSPAYEMVGPSDAPSCC